DGERVALADLGGEASGHLPGRHLRFVVVARDVPRARDEDPSLAGPLVLAAAVEEVRDVCVLLRLGGVQLAIAVLGEDLGHRLADVLLFARDGAAEVLLVPRPAGW